jgi:Tol biopolymer transport system component
MMIGAGLAILLSITATPVGTLTENQTPIVSPDGSKIAFLSNRDGQDDLYVMRADGTNVVRLTQTAESESAPYWSADSRQIRYANADGTHLRQLTDLQVAAFPPALRGYRSGQAARSSSTVPLKRLRSQATPAVLCG